MRASARARFGGVRKCSRRRLSRGQLTARRDRVVARRLRFFEREFVRVERVLEAAESSARQKGSHTSLVEAAPRACLGGLRECIRPGEGQGCRAESRGEALGGAERGQAKR